MGYLEKMSVYLESSGGENMVRKHSGIRQSGKNRGTLKRGYKYKKGGGIVKVAGKQYGKSNYKADKARSARKPGPRVSKSGRKYSERRRNRSDKGRRV